MIFVNHLSPWVFRIHVGGHDFGLRWYGLAYATGFFFAYLAFRKALERGELKGTPQTVERLVMGVIAGVLIGGRMGFVIQNPGQWIRDPLFPLRLWEGGMAFFGGLVGVMIGLGWAARKERLKFLQLTDVAAAPAMAALGLGRLANFANAELWGRPTHAAWGVIYPMVDSQPRHPSELYEAASHFLAFAVLVAMRKLKPEWALGRPGRLSALYLVLYGALRFVTDFFREEPLVGPFNTGQYASLAVAIAGCVMLAFVGRGTVSPPEIGSETNHLNA